MAQIWNWARTFSCRPRWFVEPTSIECLQTILNEVRIHQWKVRVIGCAHSPSPISMSNQLLISMKHFNRIIQIDEINREINCESGVLLSEINEVLPQFNLSLPIQGSISGITVAGSICTATHGSGIQFGSISSYVRSITLMKLNGQIVEYRLEDDEELFRCLTCSLGTFGIIISVRLQLSPLFYLQLNRHSLEFHQFLNSFSVYYRSSDHFRYMWYPHTNNGIAFHLTRISAQLINNRRSILSRIVSWFRYSLIGHHLLELLFYLSLSMPRLVRSINRLYVKFDGQTVDTIDRCDKLFNFDCLFVQYASEWAIPLDQAVSCLLELEESIEKHDHVHFPIEIRFGKSEDLSYLSPSYQRETCWINTVAYRPYGQTHTKHRPFFDCFERICAKHNGRPHWAKEHPLTNQHFSLLYPKWNLFHQKRKEFDPNDLFVNDFLKNIFQ